MTPSDFLTRAVAAARAAEHVWPGYAACEAAEESAWGESALAAKYNNLFGLKQGTFTGTLPVVVLPTEEYIDGAMRSTHAAWPIFMGWTQAFAVRMQVLRGLSSQFSDYAVALQATTGEAFVRAVSRTWSTDPKRADNVLAIYAEHEPLIVSLVQASSGTPAPPTQ